MRLTKTFFCLIGALSLSFWGCDSSADRAGIEIGNPNVEAHAFSASFVVDYALPDYSSTLAKMPAESDSVLVDGLVLSLSRLTAYSSYYTYVGFDLSEGLSLWPESASDAPKTIVFAEDSVSTNADWTSAFGDIEIDGDGLLKEIGARFLPVSSSPRVSGALKRGTEIVPFVFSLAGIDSLEVRYFKNQLSTASDGSIALTVRFCVPAWVDGLPVTSAEQVGDTVYFDAVHNAALWDSLSSRFSSAFSAAHHLTYYSSGESDDVYAASVLSSYDVIDSNWVTNGTFENSAGWILVQQLSGQADTSIANQAMTVNVRNGGTQNYSVQLIHEDVPILKGRKHKLVFTAVADSSTTIIVRFGSYNTYSTEAFQSSVLIDTVWKSYEFEYTGLVDDLFARLEFNLGKHVNRYQFKEVKIYRID